MNARIASWLAAWLSLGAVLGAFFVGATIYEHIPHLEDELAYWWQAQVFREGALTVPSPPEPQSFLVPFVVDHQGYRFSKYPPGWSLLLALGMALGAPFWVNPLLAGLAVWLTYRLGARLWSPGVGLLAAALTVTSPFFWLLAGSLLPHMATLVYTGAWALGGMAVEDPNPRTRRCGWTLMGLATAALVLTRPWTAVGVGLPFGLLAVGQWARGRWPLRGLVYVALWGLLGGLLLLAWQAATTGDPFLNPYTLWWPYDRVGFGPGHGPDPEGHTWRQAWINTRFSLQVGMADLFGWFRASWLFLPLGAVTLWRRHGMAWALAALTPALVWLYMFYWVGAWLFGPRYYFEGLMGLTLLTAAGVKQLAVWIDRGLQRRPTRTRSSLSVGRVFAGTLLGVLVALNLWGYLPRRLGMMRNLYGISRAAWAPFQHPVNLAYTPALVFVDTERWMPYGALLPLEDPWLTTPWIFAWSRGLRIDRQVAGCFPHRTILRYDPHQPRLWLWKEYFGPCPGEPLGPEGLKGDAGQAPRRHPETSP